MVLIGLIIIAVVLMALMVPGVSSIRWKLPVPIPAAGPDRECTECSLWTTATQPNGLRPRRT
jgi:hypothetical protein